LSGDVWLLILFHVLRAAHVVRRFMWMCITVLKRMCKDKSASAQKVQSFYVVNLCADGRQSTSQTGILTVTF